ncbi:Hint domain-containing protein [Ruegeria sp. 2012CJ41-6]|uniref:Hint domain-containing protein n=1 Tax=Ruegeria spongiae TaxID=2942209 RepID=A0ABT0Q7R4_9RHOB|nr:Hint domain-containing protein [Ruegeria spongiae]MCL6285923.1 Hint domain-containing protein [Ruegeria spongiae]
MHVTINSPVQSLLVYRADTFTVVEGVNQGDALSPADDLVLDDVYRLYPGSERQRLALHLEPGGGFTVAMETAMGHPGGTVHLDTALSLVSSEGTSIEAVLLVEVDTAGLIADIYLLPLAPLRADSTYTLVGMNRRAARETLARTPATAFTRGTHITLASGAQARVETLKAGDRVLTRDHGPQKVLWAGRSAVQAAGDLSLVVIRSGALNNENDLIVSPNHRLAVPQRTDTPEVLVSARHLVDGENVFAIEGGCVEYFQILFDRPHQVYAEGIAADLLPINSRVKPALPQGLPAKVSPLLHLRGKSGPDMTRALLHRPDAIDLLRRAATG